MRAQNDDKDATEAARREYERPEVQVYLKRPRSAPLQPPKCKEYLLMKDKLQAIRRRPPEALYKPMDLDELRKRVMEESVDSDGLSTRQASNERERAAARAQRFQARMAEAIRRRPPIHSSCPFALPPDNNDNFKDTRPSRPSSALPEGYEDEYKKMKERVLAVRRRPITIPRPIPPSYEERMKKEKELEEKQKKDELRRKANKALMERVETIAQRPSPVYKIKYIYT